MYTIIIRENNSIEEIDYAEYTSEAIALVNNYNLQRKNEGKKQNVTFVKTIDLLLRKVSR